MANFISISGPCTTGKTTLINSLSTYKEMNMKNHVIFAPDAHDVVWRNLVDSGLFTEYTEICSDTEYLCTYLIKVIDYYNNYIESMKDVDALIVLDQCWIDFSIYSILNMWYTRLVKSVQEEILYKSSKYDDAISRIYITKACDKNYPVDKMRLRGKFNTFRMNRPLELRYYDIAKHLKNAVALPSSDVSESSLFIINDLKNLGYI